MSRIAAMLAIALLGITASTATAQPTTAPTCPYESCAVRLTTGFWGQRIVRGAQGEDAIRISMSGSNAVTFLSRVESAAEPARAFRRKRTWSAILGIISGGTVGYYAVRTVNDVNYGSSGADQALLWVGLGTGIWSSIEGARSLNDLSRAIWEFNRAPVR